ncbi:MAG TPA: hypothetical protein DD640_00990 [Clostridiales bacterium]|nr:hypothetical protein [Clostridiales bacterium]
MGSLGDEIAEALGSRLGWEVINRQAMLARFFHSIANPFELHMLMESAKFYLSPNREGISHLDYLRGALHDMAARQSAILVGFGSQALFANDRDALHIRIISPQPTRISRIKKQYHASDEDAALILTTSDKKHRRFVASLHGIDLADPDHYHLILNTASLSVDEGVAMVVALLRERDARRQMEIQSAENDCRSHMTCLPVFKNPAETEFARILDMYQIEWRYEPRMFPIEWDSEGNVTLAFSPDFYLVKFDTYIELTTMNQKYVTMKNKKVKKLRELYPGINIKIVYKKDFQTLVERFR